ncbi:MAG TPA: HD domain-containing protein [bacterium]|nr:HD domain-containing protein [bacterium]
MSKQAGPVKDYARKIDEIARFLAEHPWEPQHSEQVRTLSMSIFDQLGRAHGCGPRERFLLEAAAMLHDIGFAAGAARHHKNSRDMIAAHPFTAISPEDASLIAQIARYHRKAHPKLTHAPFRDLDNPGREVVLKMSAILRIADGLDRSHRSSARKVAVAERGRRFVFYVQQPSLSPEDLGGAERKKALFEEVFGKKAVFTADSIPASPNS